MLTEAQILDAARRYEEAEQARRPMSPISLEHPDMTMDDAYAIQNAWVDLKQAQGRRIIGRKIGLTSKAMQRAMNIDEPDFGTLLDNMWFENGSTIPAGDFIDPKIEVEIAFVLGRDLFGEDLTVSDVIEATEYVTPSMELIAARSVRTDPKTGYTRTVLDTISDNAANAGIVVGDSKVAPADVDLRWAGAILYRNGEVEETGLGAGILDHPAHGIVWLAKRFARHGIGLQAGHFILSGSFTRPVAVAPGDGFRADFGPLGEVELSFS
ncbi:MAG: 2-oxo-hept-4-ene-1,7-dioate hydratase [Pseudomonadota bacterium]